MTRKEVKEKLQEIFIHTFGEKIAATITENSQAADVEGWDSFTYMSMIEEIENTFEISLHYRDIAGFEKVGDMIDCLEGKLQ